MLTILFLLVNTITLTLVLDCTYDFINGITIQYLTYWTYSQMDVTFANPIQYFFTRKRSLFLMLGLYIFLQLGGDFIILR